MIAELSNASVVMRDRQRVEDILHAMRSAGPGALQVISDFDMTLTRFARDGKRCPTCHSILHSSTLIADKCRDTLRELCDTYYPIEIDSSRSVEEKLPLMVEWWTQAHELLVQQKIKKSLLAARVGESGVLLRDGYRAFFERLRAHGVPLLIFSAGIGDVLEEVIRQAGVFHANVGVLSNYMDFDEAGELRAFKGQLIHTYNKRDASLLLGAGRFRDLRARPNVLLLGDSLGDLSMADGVQDMQNILKVGFLNDKVEERRPSYLSSYDIVLVKDETLDVANAILRYLAGDK